jgi:hypothetical protein
MRSFKAYSSEPSFGTYQTTKWYSRIPRENVFPYPFYFTSNPFSDEPQVDPRRAGWSPQVPEPRPYIEPDPYPDHCFQAACNTTYTMERPRLPPPPPMGAPPVPPAATGAPRAPVAPPAAATPGRGCPTCAAPPAAAAAASQPPAPSRASAGGGCVQSKCINVYR